MCPIKWVLIHRVLPVWCSDGPSCGRGDPVRVMSVSVLGSALLRGARGLLGRNIHVVEEKEQLRTAPDPRGAPRRDRSRILEETS